MLLAGDRAAARGALDEALRAAADLSPNHPVRAAVRNSLGVLEKVCGNLATAAEHYTAALAGSASQNLQFRGGLLHTPGGLAHSARDLPTAERHTRAAQTSPRKLREASSRSGGIWAPGRGGSGLGRAAASTFRREQCRTGATPLPKSSPISACHLRVCPGSHTRGFAADVYRRSDGPTAEQAVYPPPVGEIRGCCPGASLTRTVQFRRNQCASKYES